MKCKNCNADIIGRASICPICKSPVEENINDEYIYPPKKKRSKSYKYLSFTFMYVIVALAVFLIVTLVNMLYAPSMKWFWVVGIALIYAFILVENTLMSRSSIAHKILWQAIIIFAFIWSVSHILFQMGVIDNVWFWAVDIALPIVIGISNIVMAILTACMVKKDTSLVVDCISLSFTGFFPIILFLAGVIRFGYLSMAVAGEALLQIIIFLIAGRKHLRRVSKLKYRV